MADPHIQSPMDWCDYLTVIIYRCGFVLAAIMTALLPYYPAIAYLGLLTAALCCASSLHIYLKNFRFVLQFATWVALLCHLYGMPQLALGGALVTLGGLAFKEYFCFRIIGLNFQPIFLALLWFADRFNYVLFFNGLSVISALLFALLAIQKWRMPLHFDIGDKRKYQI
ncbi:DUF2301 domain-containing membrane protein [Avibacterium paragallinarum]|uniref:DUF2301 domain-containing membrane protein n=1 Tax=Avibacterium paragallinarum TaxID=728 RepID=UPI00021AD550|nr:DUF2301 domain-containing membrane protein [Avibacterium paragallinarum]AZI14650.1 hypothetical protein EIA51_08520 [Avibacterium paragallinarum]QIR11021.1 hypothetical protein HBL79_01420 [Avibacterium paragallinarum]QJE10160.1 hypothetical protein HHJ62_07585 [Avibacterium paragallinarum]QJE12354.1 hypothetical protein HHJ61_07590 [Avibacterium paragallinarum]QJE14557.1 hypothetical protein HHJ60_07610 [Avibacterium paragallinarum]